MPKKNEIVDAILAALGLPAIGETRGSTGYKDALIEAVRIFDLDLDQDATKPELAQAIAAHAGIEWLPEYDSRGTASGGGSTVTVPGWLAVQEAVEILVNELDGDFP